jgi:biotin synthase
MNFKEILKKTADGKSLNKDELVFLLNHAPDSKESYLTMAEANRISKELSSNKAEIHAQLALNLAPCVCNCMFCSFASKNGIFKTEARLAPEEAVAYALQFETEGANAIYVMTTAHYPFEMFMEISREIRKNLDPSTILIANVGDQTLANAKMIKDAGYTGVYHALRLREGIDSGISPDKRKKSIRNFQHAGLMVGTCVEPVGPEHTNEELADLILFTASIDPAFSGAARRIPIPGTDLARLGTITELRMAQIVAVTRLGMPRTVTGNCTHEPCTLGAIAGANLFWAEAGANPRDIKEKTEEGRGGTVSACRSLFKESGWNVRQRGSGFFGS